jgi:hypothetical protein
MTTLLKYLSVYVKPTVCGIVLSIFILFSACNGPDETPDIIVYNDVEDVKLDYEYVLSVNEYGVEEQHGSFYYSIDVNADNEYDISISSETWPAYMSNHGYFINDYTTTVESLHYNVSIALDSPPFGPCNTLVLNKDDIIDEKLYWSDIAIMRYARNNKMIKCSCFPLTSENELYIAFSYVTSEGILYGWIGVKTENEIIITGSALNTVPGKQIAAGQMP